MQGASAAMSFSLAASRSAVSARTTSTAIRSPLPGASRRRRLRSTPVPLDTAVSGAGVSAGSQRNGARARAASSIQTGVCGQSSAGTSIWLRALQAPQRTAAADGLAVNRRSMRATGRIRVGRRSAFSPFHGETPMAAGFGRVPEKIASSTGKCAGHENFRDIPAVGAVAQTRDAGS